MATKMDALIKMDALMRRNAYFHHSKDAATKDAKSRNGVVIQAIRGHLSSHL